MIPFVLYRFKTFYGLTFFRTVVSLCEPHQQNHAHPRDMNLPDMLNCLPLSTLTFLLFTWPISQNFFPETSHIQLTFIGGLMTNKSILEVCAYEDIFTETPMPYSLPPERIAPTIFLALRLKGNWSPVLYKGSFTASIWGT